MFVIEESNSLAESSKTLILQIISLELRHVKNCVIHYVGSAKYFLTFYWIITMFTPFMSVIKSSHFPAGLELHVKRTSGDSSTKWAICNFTLVSSLFYKPSLKTSSLFVLYLHSRTGERRFAVEAHLNVGTFALIFFQKPEG